MKKKANKVIDKFFKFFEMEAFDPENLEHKKIVQERINRMMHTEIMSQWLKESEWFNKDEVLTHEVIKFLIDCATSFYDENEFYKEFKKYEIEIVDGVDYNAAKYFDIQINSWKLDKLVPSVLEAHKKCKQIGNVDS